jgi:hypothetical protein
MTTDPNEMIKSIVEAAMQGGKTLTLPSNADAVNLRQRIYNYRNALRDNPEVSAEELHKLSGLSVKVKDNLVFITKRRPSYLETLKSQLHSGGDDGKA